jgi:CrcB protein
MTNFLYVGVGGFFGSILRYWVSGVVQQALGQIGFPYGTLAVNTLGCLAVGALAQIADTHGLITPENRSLLIIGFLGGFTTFSTFGNESMNLVRDGEFLLAALNVTANVILALGAVWLGRYAVQHIWS